MKLGTFTFMAENFTKKPDARAKLLFFQSNPTAFLPWLGNNSNSGLKDICIGHNDDSFSGVIILICFNHSITVPGIPFLSLANYPFSSSLKLSATEKLNWDTVVLSVRQVKRGSL